MEAIELFHWQWLWGYTNKQHILFYVR